MNIHSGVITTVKDKAGNVQYLTTSKYEPELVTFASYSAASWYLSIIEERVHSFEYRMGLRQVN